jgi:hypothetical protein
MREGTHVGLHNSAPATDALRQIRRNRDIQARGVVRITLPETGAVLDLSRDSAEAETDLEEGADDYVASMRQNGFA